MSDTAVVEHWNDTVADYEEDVMPTLRMLTWVFLAGTGGWLGIITYMIWEYWF